MMYPPQLSVADEKDQSSVSILASTCSLETVTQNGSNLKERNYMGLSDCSSVDSSTMSPMLNGTTNSLNLKATELRLGLPGSQSPERNSNFGCFINTSELNEKPLFPLHPSTEKNIFSGNKRGFSDAMDGFSERKFITKLDENVMLAPRTIPNTAVKVGPVKENMGIHAPVTKMKEASMVQERPTNEINSNTMISSNNNNTAPVTKAQVVGWPPIRSFRKNTLATTSKNSDEVDGKVGPGGMFVKVSMDGAPYLRKVDLKMYSAYQELSSSLEKMFSCFTICQYGSHGAQGREMLSETKLKDLLHGSEYVLTYEDKDGDWMLVGDVPWEMFIGTCKRLRIMKSTDAIGLAPRSMEKALT